MRLFIIRLVHTAIWVVMAGAVFYVLYSGIYNDITPLTWWSVALITVEALVLAFNKGACPIRVLAEQETDDHRDGFDIFVPGIIVRYNVQIFSTLFIIALALVIWRLLF